jgi:1-deoxy-D-xylulose-5-phosphate synthase
MTHERLLHEIASPEDLRRLRREQVAQVARELREEIIATVSQTGGHLASSLGSVELLTALHYVFDTPRDKLVLDVGHQGYPHKMLTGRREAFPTIGRDGGMAKFLRRAESEYDHFGAGHAGTSISAALGIARGLQHQDRGGNAIAVIGDGGMTAGMAFEALNHAGDLQQKNLVVVLNDNEMSISPNVGALSSFLSRKMSNPFVRRMKGWAREVLRTFPADALHWAHKAEESLKVFFSPGLLFEALNFRYVGPVEGNRIEVMLETFENVKQMLEGGEGPVLVHALTSKGYGYEPAQQDPFRYHGVEAFEVDTGAFAPSKPGPPKYQNVFADALIELAKEDPRIIAITAAMADGTGLDRFQRVFPDRFYDVGIAEQHAITFAAGLATEGLKPVPAIYSTFLQRAYDQVVHDVCLQNLDVTLALDRAGLVGADGATHQGLYDLSYLRTLPNILVMAPKDENELRHMLRTAVQYEGPAAIRYPRGAGIGVPLDPDMKPLPVGEAELLRDGDAAVVVALGTLVHPALEAASNLAAQGISVAVVNARFVKPLDARTIVALAERTGVVLTAEEHVGEGGFGAAVLEAISRAGLEVRTRRLAVPDGLVEHGDPKAQRARFGLDAEGIERALIELLGSDS